MVMCLQSPQSSLNLPLTSAREEVKKESPVLKSISLQINEYLIIVRVGRVSFHSGQHICVFQTHKVKVL